MANNPPFNTDPQNNQQQAERAVPSLLVTALSAAVPLRILELCKRGGPTDEDLARVKAYQKDLSEHGEDLFFRSKKPGGSAERFNQTADTIAVLSFCPGGIRIFGERYDGRAMLARYAANEDVQRAANMPENPGERRTQ
jgi:hypothetical protein